MADAEQIFNDCTLDLTVPDGVLELPEQTGDASVDEWIKHSRAVGERKQAFFDEKLDFFLVVRFQHDASAGLLSPDPKAPPPVLLSFLNHLQVSLEATYIPPTPSDDPFGPRLPAPPSRSTSSPGQTPKITKGLGIPLPIFPPQTPSPKPSTSETDKKYVYSEGTPLKSIIWGEESSDDTDSFRLLRSSSEKCWIAVYRISLPVVYLRTEFSDPLLCLTTSITLRDKPISPTPQRRTLVELIKAAGQLPPLVDQTPPKKVDVSQESSSSDDRRVERGYLEEVNLLEGLSTEVMFGSEEVDDLYLPTSRLGASARRSYSLPPITPASPAKQKQGPSSRSLPVLRKSFRKTLGLASGFHVRMRTILVPQLFLPEGVDDEQETGSDESTVVLSIEIENPVDSGAGFSVDTVEVYLKNEITKVRLIGWGEEGFSDPTKVFPLLIRPAEQYYLLYTVTFLRFPEFELSQMGDQDDFQKVVSFNIIGRPFSVPGANYVSMVKTDKLTYLTSPFLSRWNCKLDLDPRRQSMPPPESMSDAGQNAVPIPPSPFPIASPRAQQAQEQASAVATARVDTVAGPKRHTFAGPTVSPSPQLLTPQRPMSLSTSPSGSRIPSPLGKLGMKPWTVGSTPLSTPGHLSPPLPPLPNGPQTPNKNLSPPPTTAGTTYPFPQTPAFPSYGNQPMTPRPNSVTPSLGQMGTVGMGVDARRERFALPGMPITPAPPMTPRAHPGADDRALPGSFRGPGNVSLGQGNKDFVVSINLIPPISPEEEASLKTTTRQRVIHPLEEFSLEIFVFNQSAYVRTLEATLLDRRRRRDEKRDSQFALAAGSTAAMDLWKPAPPAFMALESKVRIGPLGPSTCQSVTMRFLAILPGVHTIDGLILTDVETGESISLRSVMDFAVLPCNLTS
ncbi:uncharacterized protein FOMMEDRAFT_155278 [Fomitiporia mediterranea MF3/22]|uniref:uncharacterized protein n=1 Tax=Fomitiporia mediterranea (strain MF3/22) TaxID=694068 RepID=UPI0004407927|nr:uncharacterized protein FOMMEDRAFT_155278 [Fomitiporia mediterranea MF3/22]EJD04158.1 hypothetical protein FOMMEDRAFT_155278 [Fomitiporia mediterranea MF3/22]